MGHAVWSRRDAPTHGHLAWGMLFGLTMMLLHMAMGYTVWLCPYAPTQDPVARGMLLGLAVMLLHRALWHGACCLVSP